jgi:hypothetical protein
MFRKEDREKLDEIRANTAAAHGEAVNARNAVFILKDQLTKLLGKPEAHVASSGSGGSGVGAAKGSPEPRRPLEPYFDEVQAYAREAKCLLPAAYKVLRIRRLRNAIETCSGLSREEKDIQLALLALVHGAGK